MRKKTLIVVFIAFVLLFAFIGSVDATCYKIKSKSGRERYSVYKPNENAGVSVTIVDDSNCSNQLSDADDDNGGNSTNSISNNQTYDNFKDGVVSCGNGKVKNIPSAIPKIISIGYTLIQIIVPIVLVIMGSLDLFKGITAEKEDEMAKGRKIFVKRLIYAGLIFFVFAIVRIVVSLTSETNDTYILDCAECFIKNKCD